jgi:hypothetical protein
MTHKSYYLRQLQNDSIDREHPCRYLVTEADSALEEWWCSHSVQKVMDSVISESFAEAVERLRERNWL